MNQILYGVLKIIQHFGNIRSDFFNIKHLVILDGEDAEVVYLSLPLQK
jgi:hypothetical protein